MSEQALKIGRVAKQAGVGVDTVRYYEQRGLIPPPPRRPSGYRMYPPEAVERIQFIKRAQELGFTLGEISELLALRVDMTSTCKGIKTKAREKIADIEGRIQTLERMKKVLLSLESRCPGEGPTRECPILDAMVQGVHDDER